jgi:hypothetical protein
VPGRTEEFVNVTLTLKAPAASSAMLACNGVVRKKKQNGEDAIKVLRVIVGRCTTFSYKTGKFL